MTMRLAATYLMANDRGNMVIYMDNQENAKDFTLRYLRPIFNVVPAVRDQLSANDNAKSDTIDFADGTIVYNNSASTSKDLQRISTRFVFGDELWKWPRSALGESMARTKAYEWTSKKLYASQPGLVGDDFHNLVEMTEVLDEKTVQGWRDAIPMKRGGQPEEIADVCVFLGSEMSTYISGQVLHVNGAMYT